MAGNDLDPVLVIDLGGTRLRAAVLDPYGGLLHRTSATTPLGEPEALARVMRENLEASKFTIAGAVVGVPGPVSYRDGVPLRLPNLPQWDGFVSAQGLARVIGVPVALANDADLAALGEHRLGAGRGTTDLVYITVSTGVGAGVVLGGRLAHGRTSIAEIGETLVDIESGATVEDLASGTALARLAAVPGPEATRRAAQGDPAALAAFEQVGRVVGLAIYNLVQLYAPQRVVVGGGLATAGERLLAPARRYLAERGATIEVVRSALGDDAGLRGGVVFWGDLASAPPAGAPFVGQPA